MRLLEKNRHENWNKFLEIPKGMREIYDVGSAVYVVESFDSRGVLFKGSPSFIPWDFIDITKLSDMPF